MQERHATNNVAWLTETDTSDFWTEKDQTVLDPDAVQGLMSEDIASPMDLEEFKKDQTWTLSSRLRKPKCDRMPRPDQGHANKGKIVPTLVLRSVIKSQQRMLMESDLMRFYQIIDHTATVENIRQNATVTNYKCQWEALEKKAE